MLRRTWLACSSGIFGSIALALGWPKLLADEQQANLNETLRSILKCRRPEEFAFVDLVTQKVDQGELPRPMVLSMMNWARKRSRQEAASGRRKNDIPFPYFQEGLRRQAADLGVELPAFQPPVVQ